MPTVEAIKVNQNGTVDPTDFTLIRGKILGTIESFN